ncbi:MAG: Gfo/Idh/MocA family oxidoreductase [bacterium]
MSDTAPRNIEVVPSDRPVRVAVFGLGHAAQLIHLPILSEMDSVELVGLADIEEYKLAKVSDRYNVPGFVDSEILLRQTKPDVVYVCAPTINHLPLALTALQAGSHVIVEKPVARTLDEAKRLQEAAHSAGRHVFIAMNQRFRQDVEVLRNFLVSGELGDIWRVRTGWLKRFGAWDRSSWLDKKNISGGGVMLDLGIQLLDVVLYLLDYPTSTRTVAYMHYQNLGKEVEDTLTASLTFDNGTLVHLDCSWGIMAERNTAYTSFEGTKGSATLNPLVLHKVLQNELVTVTPVKSADPFDLYQASFESQAHYFMAALKGERPPISTADEAVKVMEVVDRIYASASTGKEIV